jgi:hypothetical protein
MKSYEIRNCADGGCPHTSSLADILQSKNQATINAIQAHVKTCPSCRAEMQRFMEVADEYYDTSFGSLFKGFCKNLLIGMGATTAIVLLNEGHKLSQLFDRIRANKVIPTSPSPDHSAEIVKKLSQIERRLDVAANPTNTSGKRQGPFTR